MNGAASRIGRAAVLAAAALAVGTAPAAASDSLITVIDNSHADSWIEVDRTANVQTGKGTAGSDHDGSAVDAIEALVGGSPNHREVWDDGPAEGTAVPPGAAR
ncbi:hypothetical protein [Streptomyces broussonetiae]|uniref:hypothetical protein n=1 Tax=Streptomyces broussonetiae TaxID=2686304 RepID=UPI001E32C2BC|nr:hypothetical protein [Streptomyces broussonetiae]